MAERLTEHNITGWVLKLEDPQNEFEARQQLMNKFKLACKKLGQLEDIMDKYGVNDVEELKQKLTDRDIWEKACELLIQDPNVSDCPYPPEYYNAQDEYGSEEPYYIQESACDFADDPSTCLECRINHLYKQAKKEVEDKNGSKNN